MRPEATPKVTRVPLPSAFLLPLALSRTRKKINDGSRFQPWGEVAKLPHLDSADRSRGAGADLTQTSRSPGGVVVPPLLRGTIPACGGAKRRLDFRGSLHLGAA
jgi:hypothetical protein